MTNINDFDLSLLNIDEVLFKNDELSICMTLNILKI